MLSKCLFERFCLQRRAQFCREVYHIGPGAARNVNDLATEKTEAARDNGVALLEQVAQDGLRAGKA